MVPGTFFSKQHGAEKTGRDHEDAKSQRFLQVMPQVLAERSFQLHPPGCTRKYPDRHRSHDTKRMNEGKKHCRMNDLKQRILYINTRAKNE